MVLWHAATASLSSVRERDSAPGASIEPTSESGHKSRRMGSYFEIHIALPQEMCSLCLLSLCAANSSRFNYYVTKVTNQILIDPRLCSEASCVFLYKLKHRKSVRLARNWLAINL